MRGTLRPSIGRAALLLALATGGGVGCQNDCVTLAQTICECAPTQLAQQSCQSQVSIASGVAVLGPADLSRCTRLLQSCDCRRLTTNTLAAKVACGLALPDPNDRSLSP